MFAWPIDRSSSHTPTGGIGRATLRWSGQPLLLCHGFPFTTDSLKCVFCCVRSYGVKHITILTVASSPLLACHLNLFLSPQFNLHATAPSWTPPASFTPSAPVVTPPATSASAPALAAASVPIGTKPEPQKAAAPAPPKKDAPAPASAWGKKTAASVVAAPAPAKPAPTAASVATKAAAAPPAKVPAAAPAPAAKPAPAAAAPTATSPAPAPAAAAPTAAAAGAAASKAPASAWGSKGGLSSAVRAAPPPMPAQPAKPLRSTKGGKDSKADKKGGRDGGKDAKGNARDGGKNKGGGRDDNRRGGKGDRKDGKGRDGGQNGKQERQKSEGGRGQKKQDAPPTEEKKADAPTPVAPAPAPVPALAPADTKKEVTAASIVAAPAPAPAPAAAAAAAATAAAPAAAASTASTAPAPTPAVATGGSWASLAKKPGVPSAAQVVQQSAPKPTQGQQRQSSQGGKGGQHHGQQHGHGQQGRHQQNQHGGNNNSGWQRGNRLPAEMCKPGEGSNDAEKAVVRHVVKDLLAMRLSYLAPPLSWGDSEPGPPEHCKWDSPTRVQEIDSTSKAPRMGGDVGQQQKRRKSQHNDTAPALEDCKPLEVNNDTRWKAGVFNKDKPQEDEDSDEVITKKALLILNKLSLTKFDKLSDDFIATGIGKNEKILHDIIWTIVGKAQDEPHFAAMYASLCLKLSQTPLELEADAPKKGKKFKKLLLERCQQEFETNTAEKIADATKDVEDEEEKAYQAGLVKKHYIGHMRFIGELYRADLITIKIMLFCLPALLEGETTFSEESAASSTSDEKEDSDEIDEEKVECFTKLMTTIGSSLEQQSMAMKNAGKIDAAEKLGECWANVERMAGLRKDGHAPAVSNRIKFMLQDLIEMRKKGKLRLCCTLRAWALYLLCLLTYVLVQHLSNTPLLSPTPHTFLSAVSLRMGHQAKRRDRQDDCPNSQGSRQGGESRRSKKFVSTEPAQAR